MNPMPAQFAHAHLAQRVRAAEQQGRRQRLVAAARAQRRAERAALRARLLLARTH